MKIILYTQSEQYRLLIHNLSLTCCGVADMTDFFVRVKKMGYMNTKTPPEIRFQLAQVLYIVYLIKYLSIAGSFVWNMSLCAQAAL